MRYRGGGVGHLYMRAIEVWLAETGWGSHDSPTFTNEDSDSEEGSKDSEDNEDGRVGGNSEDEVPEDDRVGGNSEDGVPEDDAVSDSGTVYSEQEIDPDVDPDAEYLSSEDDEETMDGQYGFSSL